MIGPMPAAIPLTIKPMLSKTQPTLPTGDGWLYEPKWDGFRAFVFRDGDHFDIISRDGRPLGRYFPELPDLLAAHLPEACVVDGEIVLATHAGLDFDALQLRIHPAASRVKLLAEQLPASYVAFDLIAVGNDDLRDVPQDRRRALLEEHVAADVSFPATAPGSRVLITPQTVDAAEAQSWFDSLEDIGIEGIIAKRPELLYRPGERVMVKVKHVRTADCIVGGYRLNKTGDGIGSLLLGLYGDEGALHYIGHTSSFKAPERRQLLTELSKIHGESFGGARSPGGPSRWTGGRDTSWQAVEPVLVCEVRYDKLQAGHRFRHAATFVRWRTDKAPEECTFDQLA